MWQYRWNKFLVLLGVFGIPLAVGFVFGRPIAGLLWGGFLRITITHHSTFLVNSMAHSVGKPTFAAEVSARDNWVLALATFGEGYHSFHHKFPADFRNGVRWYDWDPAKWLIWALRSVGLATKLRSTAAPVVEQARMHAAVQQLEHKLETIPTNLGDEIRARIMRAKGIGRARGRALETAHGREAPRARRRPGAKPAESASPAAAGANRVARGRRHARGASGSRLNGGAEAA